MSNRKRLETKQVKIDHLNWNEYRALYLVTKKKDGAVYKTKFFGYCHVDDEQFFVDETCCSATLSTKLLSQTIQVFVF